MGCFLYFRKELCVILYINQVNESWVIKEMQDLEKPLLFSVGVLYIFCSHSPINLLLTAHLHLSP